MIMQHTRHVSYIMESRKADDRDIGSGSKLNNDAVCLRRHISGVV
jgi:hypothetical protein